MTLNPFLHALSSDDILFKSYLHSFYSLTNINDSIAYSTFFSYHHIFDYIILNKLCFFLQKAGQLFDKSKVIPWVALEILDEACHDKMNLEALVCALAASRKKEQSITASLEHLGMGGVFLVSHFLTSSNGLKHLVQVRVTRKSTCLVVWI